MEPEVTRGARKWVGSMAAGVAFVALAVGLIAAFRMLPTAMGMRPARAQAGGKVVQAAVIGGMTMTGMWQQVAAMFERDTGIHVETIATGERNVLSETMRSIGADLLTMHSGDITTNLVADGYGINMRPWARNDLVIVGPASDPAGIAGLTDGVEALRRIAATQSRFLDCRDIGAREVGHNLWATAGIIPTGAWVLQDGSEVNQQMVRYAEQQGAYVIVGRMPLYSGKAPIGGMRILVDGDPAMRRPYVVMEANPAMCPGANSAGAKALSDYLLSDKVQTFLTVYGKEENGGVCPFHPVEPAARL